MQTILQNPDEKPSADISPLTISDFRFPDFSFFADLVNPVRNLSEQIEEGFYETN